MKKIINVKWNLIPVLAILGGCSFVVLSPKPTNQVAVVNEFKRLPTNQLQMKIVFNKPYDKTTIIVTKTLILKFAKNSNADAVLTYPDAKTLIVTTNGTVTDLMTFNPDGGWCLTLVGDDKGNGVVKESGGKVLDGDYNGKEGGDYVMCYRIIG